MIDVEDHGAKSWYIICLNSLHGSPEYGTLPALTRGLLGIHVRICFDVSRDSVPWVGPLLWQARLAQLLWSS